MDTKDGLETAKGDVRVRTHSVDEFGNPLTAYDRKSLLVNQQLDRIGMGRYQWFIVGLCAMGYMLGASLCCSFRLC